MRRILLALVGTSLLVGLCATLGLDQFIAAVERASPVRLLLFILIGLSAFTVYAIRWQIVMKGLGGSSVPLPVLILARISGHAAGMLVPSAQLSSAAVRAALLRRRGIAWGPLIIGIAVDRLLELTASAIVGPIYLVLFLQSTGAAPKAAGSAVALLAVGIIGILAAWLHLGRADRLVPILVRRGLLPHTFDGHSTTQSLRTFLRSRRLFAALGLSFLIEALLFAEFTTFAWSFGIELSPGIVGGVLIGMGLSHLVPIPGSLGSLEATQIGILRLAGGAANFGLAIGLLVRLRETFWTLLGIAWIYIEGIRFPVKTSGNASRIDVNP